jgi:hypothetical protein
MTTEQQLVVFYWLAVAGWATVAFLVVTSR